MKKLLLVISLLSLQSCIGAGSNSPISINKTANFPELSGIDLQGKERELPEAFEGKLNIVVVAFKREQQAEVDSWIKATDEIVKKTDEIRFYEVPLIYEMSAFSRTWINNGMRRGVPDEEARERTITVYTNRAKFFEITKMKEENIYLLLISKKGKILWRIEGAATDAKMKNLKAQIKKYI